MYKFKHHTNNVVKNSAEKEIINMIKGVTRNVIEINNMDSRYFERAFVILKSDCEIPDEDTVRREASLSFYGEPPSFIKSTKITQRIKMALSAVAGALIGSAICLAAYLFV